MKKKAHIVRTRVADANNVVHTVRGGEKNAYCKVPCPECPWRKDRTGRFPAEAFRISANTSYDAAMETFACHMKGADNPGTCAGFLLRGSADNLAVRIGMIDGKFLDVTDGGLKLHKSYRAMAVANGVDPDDPVLEQCMPEARFKPFVRKHKT